MLTDNASGFASVALNEAFTRAGIKGKRSTPYNPQGNGIVERVIGTIKNALFGITGNEFRTRKQLQKAVQAYNHSRHSTTEFSPYFMMYHRNANGALAASIIPGRSRSTVEAVEEGIKLARQANRTAKANIRRKCNGLSP